MTTKSELLSLGFSQKQCRVPALLIPIIDVNGQVVNYQCRPDQPRVDQKGKVIKYETIAGSRMALDVPPASKLWLDDPTVPLFVTEGVRKADSAASLGLCCMDVLGVYNWRGTNEYGGKLALPDWESIALNDRQVYICFDSDVVQKPAVHNAMVRLKAFLESRGAIVSVIYLPPGPNGQKNGLDDYFAAGHNIQDLLLFARPDIAVVADESTHSQHMYTMNNDGIFRNNETPDGSILSQLTNFTATIVAQVVVDDGTETTRMLEIESNHLGKVKRFLLPASRFSNLSWIIEYIGVGAVVLPGSTNREHSVNAIQLLSGNELQEMHVYGHTGWRQIDGQWVFLHANGGIGPDGATDNVEVSLPESLSRFKLPDAVDGSELKVAILDSMKFLQLLPDEVAFPLYASTWMAPALCADFSMHLSGTTGAGKSEIAALLQQHFGSELDSRHLPGSWSSTGNSLEAATHAAKDVPFVIDDFAPGGSGMDISRAHREADRIFRAQGNASGRQRMRSDSSLRPVKPPRGLIISTGEDVPRGESLRARLFVVELNSKSITWDLLTECQKDAVRGQYALAMSGYLQWMASKRDRLLAEQGALLEEFSIDAAAKTVHKRTPRNAARLGYGLHIFLEYAVAMTAISVEERDVLWNRGWSAILTGAGCQAQLHKDSDPAARFVDLLRGAISCGAAHLCDRDGGIPENPEAWGWRSRTSANGFPSLDWEPQGTKVGWLCGDDLYLEPESALAVVQRLSRDSGDTIPVTPRTLHKRLNEQGLLVSTDSGRNTLIIRRTLQGVGQKVLHINAATIFGGLSSDMRSSTDTEMEVARPTDPLAKTEKLELERGAPDVRAEGYTSPSDENSLVDGFGSFGSLPEQNSAEEEWGTAV